MFPLAHPRFRHVEPGVFTRRVVADCMSHRCTLVASHREKLDACCQYGVDVTESERANIERRAPQIRALLRAPGPWFGTDIELDPDTGPLVRTRVVDDGCIFLAHDRRGCAIHRASIENDWDYRGTKPHVSAVPADVHPRRDRDLRRLRRLLVRVRRLGAHALPSRARCARRYLRPRARRRDGRGRDEAAARRHGV
jgi:hypothetical protein